jgi:hypothetical protein
MRMDVAAQDPGRTRPGGSAILALLFRCHGRGHPGRNADLTGLISRCPGLSRRSYGSGRLSGSNAVSRALGYEPNGTTWPTRRGNPAPLARGRLTREHWEQGRRDDIQLTGAEACLPVLGLDQPQRACRSRQAGTGGLSLRVGWHRSREFRLICYQGRGTPQGRRARSAGGGCLRQPRPARTGPRVSEPALGAGHASAPPAAAGL